MDTFRADTSERQRAVCCCRGRCSQHDGGPSSLHTHERRSLHVGTSPTHNHHHPRRRTLPKLHIVWHWLSARELCREGDATLYGLHLVARHVHLARHLHGLGIRVMRQHANGLHARSLLRPRRSTCGLVSRPPGAVRAGLGLAHTEQVKPAAPTHQQRIECASAGGASRQVKAPRARREAERARGGGRGLVVRLPCESPPLPRPPASPQERTASACLTRTATAASPSASFATAYSGSA